MQMKNMYSIWAELPSPLKTEFRNLFQSYASHIYERNGLVLTSYVPSEMGGNMPAEDYLVHMKEEQLPQCYITQSFGECSHSRFISRFLDHRIYKEPEIFGYFPEFMVVDLKRLGSRPVPESYEQLCLEDYKGEICLIGSPKIPDPMAALYIYRKLGEEAMIQFIKNIGNFASPVDTIRDIGKSTNEFGSIFIMPSLFASVCAEKRHTAVIIPKTGVIAEPMIFMEHRDACVGGYIREFLFSKEMKFMLENKQFVFADGSLQRIDTLCQKSICPELEFVYLRMIQFSDAD